MTLAAPRPRPSREGFVAAAETDHVVEGRPLRTHRHERRVDPIEGLGVATRRQP